MDPYPHPPLDLTLDHVRVIVLAAALFVLCGLPTVLILLAYATHRERNCWREAHKKLWQEKRQRERAEQAARYCLNIEHDKEDTSGSGKASSARKWSRRLRRDSSPPASPRGSSLDKDEPWRAKSVFQKLKDALMALRLNIIGHDEIDPLIATKMYHVPTSDKDASNEGGHPPSEAESLASSEGNGGLDARVARLRRAQRLLQRNQPMEGAGQYREVTVSRKV
ncbi:hypothetical protein BD289DRAFT_481251 [Coniella lustricola]|uniref:Uncharacterized protein n=1 Tax=Coniella lustricola TaxID=2025994 RepID=A0A2T3ACY5_9PEZI|nr:hypothetical protein BD289DRAFT_481251 [Coniella lustricola]